MSAGDGVVEYVVVDLYWGRCSMAVYFCTGDVVVDNGAVKFYWEHSGRV